MTVPSSVEEKVEVKDQKITASINDFQPVGSRVLIRVEALQKRTSGGIELPDEVAQAMRPARGIVVARGQDCHQIQVGDYVVFMMYAGSVVEEPDEEARKEANRSGVVYRVVREAEVFGLWDRDTWSYVEPAT